MEFTIEQVAEVLQGEVVGNGEAKVSSLAKIEEGKEGSLCFLANPKYEQYLYQTEATAVIVNKSFTPEKEVKATLIKVGDAYSSFAQLLEFYNSQKPKKQGVSKKADISELATYGENVYIGAFVSIGDNVTIGDNTSIFPNAVIGDNAKIGNNTVINAGVNIYDSCKVGDDCILHSGAVIGSDGFGFAPQEDGTYKKIAQTGNVEIGNNVEIGANTTIDRATMGSTIIHDGVKLDNLVQIAHNVEIGENSAVAAQTGISGSVKLGENCIIAGQVGIAGHIIIGDKVTIAAQSGIGSNVKTGRVMFGSPAIDYKKQVKSLVHFRNFDKIVSKLNDLEQEIKKNKQY